MKNAFPLLMLVTAIIAVFAVSGCTQQPEVKAFIGGTDGLVISFQDLPSTVFSKVPFRLAVRVQNVGEAAVDEGKAIFVLNNAQNFNIANPVAKNSEQSLPAARRLENAMIPGGQAIISWGQQAIFTGQAGVPLPEEQPLSILISACYPYSSFAVTTACIARSNGICEPVGEKTIQSSGAPIQVTKYKQVAQEKDSETVVLNFIIDIENKGDGDVYGSGADCLNLNSEASAELQNRVDIVGIALGNETIPLTACIDDHIELSDGKGSISCSFDVPAKVDFVEELALTLSYKYKQRMTIEITVLTPKSS